MMKRLVLLLFLLFSASRLFTQESGVITILFPTFSHGSHLSNDQAFLVTAIFKEKLFNKANIRIIESAEIDKVKEEAILAGQDTSLSNFKVDFMVLGSVELVYERVYLTVRLINLETREHMLARDIDVTTEDFTDEVDNLASLVASEMIHLRYGITLKNVERLIRMKDFSEAERTLDLYVDRNGKSPETQKLEEKINADYYKNTRGMISGYLDLSMTEEAANTIPEYLLYDRDKTDINFVGKVYESRDTAREKERDEFLKKMNYDVRRGSMGEALILMNSRVQQLGYEGKEQEYNKLDLIAKEKIFQSSLKSSSGLLRLNRGAESRFYVENATHFYPERPELLPVMSEYDVHLQKDRYKEGKSREALKPFTSVARYSHSIVLGTSLSFLGDKDYRAYVAGYVNSYECGYRSYNPLLVPLHFVWEAGLNYSGGDSVFSLGTNFVVPFQLNIIEAYGTGGLALSFYKFDFSMGLKIGTGWFYRKDSIDMLSKPTLSYGLGFRGAYLIFDRFAVELKWDMMRRLIFSAGNIKNHQVGLHLNYYW